MQSANENDVVATTTTTTTAAAVAATPTALPASDYVNVPSALAL